MSDTPQSIVERIASSTGVDAATITGTSRRHAHVRARHAAALALHRARLSYSAIGRVLGSQEHTSAIYACKRALIREAADITSAPVVWCCGVSTSHAYHHGASVCVVRGRWVTRGEAA